MGKSLQFFIILPSLIYSTMGAPSRAADEVNAEDPVVQACAAFALEAYNFFSQQTHLYFITSFNSVKRENVGAGLYDMDVELRESVCLKSGEQGQAIPKNCQKVDSSPGAKVYRCHFSVLNVPWQDERVLLNSNCSEISQ